MSGLPKDITSGSEQGDDQGISWRESLVSYVSEPMAFEE